MKLIVAIVRPEKLETIQTALNKKGICLMSVSQVVGYGREEGIMQVYRSTKTYSRKSKLRLEIAVNDFQADDAVDAIVSAAATGHPGQVGDGKVFVMELDQCVRVRDRERGPYATGTSVAATFPASRSAELPEAIAKRQFALPVG